MSAASEYPSVLHRAPCLRPPPAGPRHPRPIRLLRCCQLRPKEPRFPAERENDRLRRPPESALVDSSPAVPPVQGSPPTEGQHPLAVRFSSCTPTCSQAAAQPHRTPSFDGTEPPVQGVSREYPDIPRDQPATQ